ncbi:HK97 gp10 family phage protein [Rhodovulum sulfidophilum]|nr:HK97 gp10 family phage protein [Rhodovulum sulfidophilum]
MAIKVEGLDDLNRQLRKIARDAPEAAQRGAYAGGLLIQGEGQKLTPVEHNNLRGSAYTQKIPKGAEVGFSAEYAIFVHENLEQKRKGKPRPSGLGTYWNPGGPKFLEKAVDENAEAVRDLVEAEIRKALEQ